MFVDGSMSRSAMMQSMTIAGIVLVGCAALVLILIFLLSKKAVKPIAESYEKQKQFVTDANHELKTPLTLILANIDIAEAELGRNEWLDDIRAEGHRMTDLGHEIIDFITGQLAAFAGLGSLRHFDLNISGVAQIIDRNAETSAGDLLDGGVELGAEAFGVLAAFAAVAHRADGVHGLRDGLVRLRAE